MLRPVSLRNRTEVSATSTESGVTSWPGPLPQVAPHLSSLPGGEMTSLPYPGHMPTPEKRGLFPLSLQASGSLSPEPWLCAVTFCR